MTFKIPKLPIIAGLLLPAIAVVLLSTGCRSANPDVSNRMASIIATNRSPESIEAAVRTVFERNDFTEGRSDDDRLIFERPGSFVSGMVYSDWYSGGVWERIKVYRRVLSPERTLVECDGYMVKEHDDPLFSEEKRQYKTKRSHCQKFMDEVALELEHPTGTNAPPASK